ncbi:MAG: hypothetical protein Q7S50_01740 [bacterium]|nr:hypothetical protein [bacterium]
MRTQRIFWVSFAAFVLLLFVVPHPFISSDLGNTVLTVIAFLFGIIAGFYIVVTTTDYNSVKNILSAETAGWINLYDNVLTYDRPLAEKLSGLVDVYLRRNFDFEIIEYAEATASEYQAIVETVRSFPVKPELLPVYQIIRGIMHDISIARQQLTVLGARTLSRFQWAILLILAALFILSLYGLRTGTLFFDIVTLAISSAVVLVLLLIHYLDLYIWNERTFGFDIFENVFRAIGQLPYYPGESIADGRVRPKEKKYRVGVLMGPPGGERKIEVHTGT